VVREKLSFQSKGKKRKDSGRKKESASERGLVGNVVIIKIVHVTILSLAKGKKKEAGGRGGIHMAIE